MINLRRASKNRYFLLVPLLSTIILAGFLVMLYVAYSTPVDVVTVNKVAVYKEAGSFYYVASLKPNFIYGTSILRPDEGVLYTRITDEVKIYFNYSLDGSPNPENVSMHTGWEIGLSSNAGWSKVFSETDASRIFKIVTATTTNLTVNVTDVMKYANIIEEEAGFYPSSFNLTITPRITESFTIAGRPITSIYSQPLTVEFHLGDKNGDYISMLNMMQSEEKSIDTTVTAHNDSVESQRIIWLIGAILSFSISAGSTLLKSSSAHPKDNELEKILASHRELIIKNNDGPSNLGKKNVLDSFEDLVKASEILLKPILLYESEDGYVFWIYDGNVQYQFSLAKKKVDGS